MLANHGHTTRLQQHYFGLWGKKPMPHVGLDQLMQNVSLDVGTFGISWLRQVTLHEYLATYSPMATLILTSLAT
jgi:hypothetical protein